jgi:hypothetical protein
LGHHLMELVELECFLDRIFPYVLNQVS